MTPQKQLIEEIRSIVLGAGMMDIASRDGVEMIAAIVLDQRRKEREACATLARERTVAAGRRNAKSLWRQEIGEEIALAILGRNGERG